MKNAILFALSFLFLCERNASAQVWEIVPQARAFAQNQSINIDGASLQYNNGFEVLLDARLLRRTYPSFIFTVGYRLADASREDKGNINVNHGSRLKQLLVLAGIRYDLKVIDKGRLFFMPQAGMAVSSVKYELRTEPQLALFPMVNGTDTHTIPVMNINAGIDYRLQSDLIVTLSGRAERSFWKGISYSYSTSSTWLSGKQSFKTSSSGLNLALLLGLGYVF